MPTSADFSTFAQWAAIATLACAALSGLAFLLKWGLRFRLVGATGFMLVLTAGLLALGLAPFTRTVVPGAIRFFTVFDSGAAQAVIVVPPTVTDSQLAATLEQAASDLFSMGRLGRGEEQLTIRARTVLHPAPGVSQPLILGQVKRSLAVREDPEMTIELFPDNLAKLPVPTGDSASSSLPNE